MAEHHFEVVTIETGQPGRLANITNIQQIVDRLNNNWPAAHRGGVAYQRAVKACMDNITGKKNIEAVRAAFIEAAKDADIFVREGQNSE